MERTQALAAAVPFNAPRLVPEELAPLLKLGRMVLDLLAIALNFIIDREVLWLCWLARARVQAI